MDNKKKLTIVLAVFAIVCVFAVLVFSGVLGGIVKPGEEQSTDSADFEGGTDYTAALLAKSDNDLPYLETDIENIFYTMSTEGEVKFFKLDETTFFPVEATGTYDVSVKLSEQNLSTTVTYLEQDGVISGYGLYTGKTDEFDLYPYAFFRLTNYGEKYEQAYSTSCLLLVDTTEDDFYSNEKIFEEPFIFNFEESSCSRQLSEANRTVGISGTKRSDYCLINDTVIDGSVSHQLFFSGRQYGEDDERVDLLRSGGSGNNTDNIRIARDVIGYWATYIDDGIMYIVTDDNEDVTVEKFITDSEKTETVKTFEGVKRNDILVSDDSIYVISTNTVYDISEGTEKKLDYEHSDEFKADLFVCNGDKFVVRGYISDRYPAVVCASVSTGKVSSAFSDEMFRNVVNPILSGDSMILTVQENDKFTYYIF